VDLNNVIEQQITDSRELFESKLSQIFNNSENDWHSKKLNEVGFIGRGKSKHRPRNDKSLYNGVYPFIQTGDIRNAPFVIEKYTQTYNEKGLKQSKLWPKGTLCITIAANIAETSILGMDACFPDSVIGFIPENGNSAFYQYLMMFNKIELQKRGKGSAQDNINLGTFESMSFIIPPDKKQKQIVKELNELSEKTKELEVIFGRKIADLKELKKSYLEQAFSGKM
jgi:type I restriction enzyme S subunit